MVILGILRTLWLRPGDPPAERALSAIALVFLINGTILSRWISRIPAITERHGLGKSEIGQLIRANHQWQDERQARGEIMTAWNQESFEEAVRQAAKSLSEGGVPVGSALDIDGSLVASGHNRRVQDGDPIAHGEMSCLRAAGRQRSYRDAVLYTTLAPCAMCAGTIIQFGIPTVVVGESETFPGELEWLRSRSVDVIELDDDRCKRLMSEFQERYPEVWAEDIGEV